MASNNFNRSNLIAYQEQKKALAKANYETAVIYYTQLKNMFFEILSEEFYKQENEIFSTEDALVNAVIQGISENTQNKSIDDMQKALEKAMIGKNINMSAIRAALFEVASTGQTDENVVRNYLSRASAAIDRALGAIQAKELENLAFKTLQQSSIQQGVTITNNSLTGAYGLLKRIIMTQALKNRKKSAVYKKLDKQYQNLVDAAADKALSNDAKQGYSWLLGGYFREIATKEALQNILKKSDNFLVQQTATSQDGKNDPYYDITIDILNGKASTHGKKGFINLPSFSTQGIGTINIREMVKQSSLSTFGIQSKSWVSPSYFEGNEKRIRNNWYRIGLRGDILRQIGPLNRQGEYDPTWDRGWHNSVAICSSIITSLLGSAQVAYSLGNGFIFTYQLIKQMMENKLWLSFYFQRKDGEFKYPATSEVAWQPTMYLYKILRKRSMAKAAEKKKLQEMAKQNKKKRKKK